MLLLFFWIALLITSNLAQSFPPSFQMCFAPVPVTAAGASMFYASSRLNELASLGPSTISLTSMSFSRRFDA